MALKMERPNNPKKYIKITGPAWGDEKEVLKVSKLDPIFIPLQFYYLLKKQ
jgi:hypothetical protein